MVAALLAYLGGILTIVSPCILPVLPFVFARADRPFLRNGLPMLAGMALTFAGVATLAAVAGGWAVAANEYGRAGALVLLAVFGVTLLMPRLSERLTRPLVALGARLSQSADGAAETSFFSAILLGVAVGSALGAVCRSRARRDPDRCRPAGRQLRDDAAPAHLCRGRGDFAGSGASRRRASLDGDEALARRRRMGATRTRSRDPRSPSSAIALGLDTGFLTKVSLATTASLEQGLLTTFESAHGRTGQRARRRWTPTRPGR